MSFPQHVARWNERFGGDDYHFGTEPNAFLASQAHRLRPGMSALSVADGEGRNSVWLARHGLNVTAFDVSPVGVDKARRLAREAGVTVDHRVADINDWDWDAARYDLVVAIFIQFASPPERARIFAGMMRALAPGGLLLLQGYTPRQLEYKTGGPGVAENLYTSDLLRSQFAALEILHLAEHDDVIREGKGHSGMSALVDLVARRPA
jgi:2-polyprenyl-3-methyl-5-hydroxy-6-metoxy-1,4-benzoquinol methylase